MQTDVPRASAFALGDAIQPLHGTSHDYDHLLSRIGNARFVLLGEASHGTHEFYEARAAITMRLIREKGFNGVAVEADWPDAYRVNRYVRKESADKNADEALSDFVRFPKWMWRNTEVVQLINRLREHNEARPVDSRVGFYGLDLYSLHASMGAVLSHLERVDPDAAKRARERYSCFDHFGKDAQQYGFLTTLQGLESCEKEVVQQLKDMKLQAATNSSAVLPSEEHFAATQNARLAVNAEAYYRSMFYGRDQSWNLRDRHMAETVGVLADHLSDIAGRPAKLVIWEHNSHLGDARATEMAQRGELNVGQLLRERYRSEVFSVGFSTYTGTVTAASNWGDPAHRKRVRPALDNSYEQLFHHQPVRNFIVDLQHSDASSLRSQRLERAIGVIYRPETERLSHYFTAHLPQQFDSLIHFDTTHALRPLDPTSQWEEGEPETFPFGV